MSMENAKKFYEAVAVDEELREKINALLSQYQNDEINEGRIAAIVEKDILPVASQMGLDFTLAELQQYGEQLQTYNADHEMSEEELEAVAGGWAACLLISASEADQNGNFCACVVFGYGNNERERGGCFGIGVTAPT